MIGVIGVDGIEYDSVLGVVMLLLLDNVVRLKGVVGLELSNGVIGLAKMALLVKAWVVD